VAVPWPRGPPRSSLLRVLRLGWGPWTLTAVVLVLPEPMAGEALQQPAAVAALAGVGGYRRWPLSVGKPNETTLSLSMSSVENAILFVLLLLFCSMPSA